MTLSTLAQQLKDPKFKTDIPAAYPILDKINKKLHPTNDILDSDYPEIEDLITEIKYHMDDSSNDDNYKRILQIISILETYEETEVDYEERYLVKKAKCEVLKKDLSDIISLVSDLASIEYKDEAVEQRCDSFLSKYHVNFLAIYHRLNLSEYQATNEGGLENH